MSSDEYAIEINGLSKCYQIYDKPSDRLKQMLHRGRRQYYKEFWALKDVSFKIKKGETIGIIGRNGSGKSTLLQMICGTLNPTQGNITTNGKVAALLELGSGFNPEFTGRENVYLNGAVLGLSKEEIDARFEKIIIFADIGEFIDQPVKTYSSGMLVRLAFSVIAHVDADILIIDEALAVGDAVFTQKCMRFLRNFMDKGTILFVSHDTGAVLNLCSSAVWIQKGLIKENGPAKHVIERYLEDIHLSIEATATEEKSHTPPQKIRSLKEEGQCFRDMRDDFINASVLRNDIEIFQLKSDVNSFGMGGAEIISVRILDSQDRPLSWIVGGEDVTLEISAITKIKLHSPIIGFQLKDRLGQVIFSDNTYLTYAHCPLHVDTGQKLVARFNFTLPRLPSGDYSIDPAIADGTQEKHIQQQWLRDALMIKVHSSSVCLGLIGVPMRGISLEIQTAA